MVPYREGIVLVCLLFLYSTALNEEPYSQRFDGRYNNLNQPEWGAAGVHLERNVTPVYSDYTYKPSGNDRPSARLISNVVFAETSGRPSHRNRTALFAFFSQLVAYELSDIDGATCPVEVLRVPVPENDPDFKEDFSLPYERVQYDRKSGQSPNNPRRQLNQASSFIDGSFIYGTSTVWANSLRALDGTGKLQAQDSWRNFPSDNTIGLPLDVYPDITQNKPLNPNKLWRLGDPHVHENPALLSLGLVFFRYHNYVAEKLSNEHPHWGEEKLFFSARRWVVAVLQNIIIYEWLPKLLNEDIPSYSGYKPHIPTSLSDVFDAGAMKYFTTLIPSGIHRKHGFADGEFFLDLSQLIQCNTVRCLNWRIVLRGNRENIMELPTISLVSARLLTSQAYMGSIIPECKKGQQENRTNLRLCQTFWNSQEIVMTTERAMEDIIVGLASQYAENEDHEIVRDLRGKFYGPLQFSRHDFIVQIIMKGRDYGLPDYNTVRHEVGLSRKKTFKEINPDLFNRSPQLLQNITDLFESLDKMDLFAGGMLETSHLGPGELFRGILRDQFLRLRDGDRFWFENENNEIFSPAEIMEIKNTTLYDVIVYGTHLDENALQKDVFTGAADDACMAPVYLPESDLGSCPEHQGYDYFQGSEAAFIIIWTCFGFFPFACIIIACIIAKCKSFKYHESVKMAQKAQNDCLHIKSLNTSSSSCLQVSEVQEWLGSKDEFRRAEVHITYRHHIELYSMKGTLLRAITFKETDVVTIVLSINKKRNVLLIGIPKEYDMVLQFPNETHRIEFENQLCKLLSTQNIETSVKEAKLEYIYEKAFTRQKRNEILEKFFKMVFTEDYAVD